jgi:ABC-type multidrug transport system fused ATPase/permease subunit
MGDAVISSEFEYSASFLRILIPGVITVTLVSSLVVVEYFQSIFFVKESVITSVWNLLPLVVIFVVVSMLIGLIINVFIPTLTLMLEGYYLPQDNIIINKFWEVLKERQWKKFNKYMQDYDSAEMDSMKRGKAYTNLYNYFSCCLYKISNNPDISDNELKKVILPTELGNVMRSSEIYPEWKYGMNFFFLARIQLLMSEEDKETLDKTSAFVDMFVALTWIFFVAAITYSIVFAFNEDYKLLVISLIGFIALSLISYGRAVESALNLGYYHRSIFDLYREELWNKLKNGLFRTLSSYTEKEAHVVLGVKLFDTQFKRRLLKPLREFYFAHFHL